MFKIIRCCKIIIVIYVISLINISCSSSPPQKNKVNQIIELPWYPSWVVKLPQDSEYIYAVGSCPRTHVREDAEPRAEDDAKQELSRSIKVEVRSVMVDLEGEEGQTGSYSQLHEEKSVKVDDNLVESILDKAELIEFWFDKSGIAGEKENTYALVRIPRREIRNKLGNFSIKKTGGIETSTDYSSPPSWLIEIPQDDEYIYAIGSCSKTYRRKDAEERALENARVELSRSISLDIQSVLFDIHSSKESKERSSIYEQRVTFRLDRYVSEAVLSGSQALAFWYDKKGVAGDKGITYALVRISKKGIKEELNSIADEKSNDEIDRD
jgi:hypothetical protein